MELVDVASRLGSVLERREEKEEEVQALSTMVRSICESTQSFTTGYSQADLAELFNSNSVFQEVLDHMRRCEAVLLDFEAQNRAKHIGIADKSNGNARTPSAGPFGRAADYGRELVAEGLEALSGHVGQKLGGMLRLPPDALVRLRNSSSALQRLVPFLHMAISASALARANSARSNGDEPTLIANGIRLAERRQGSLANQLSRSVTVPEHGGMTSGSRTLSLGNLSEVSSGSCEHIGAEPLGKVLRTEAMRDVKGAGAAAAAAASVPRWQLRIRSDLVSLADEAHPVFTIDELRWEEAASPLQRTLGRKELAAYVPRTWLHPATPHNHILNYISRDHVTIEVHPTLEIPDPVEALEAETLSLPPGGESLGETLPLPTGSSSVPDDATIVGTMRPLSKLTGGAHILDAAAQKWTWVRRGESSIIREGDLLALILHPKPGSSLPDCMRDGIAVGEVRCLLGIDFSGAPSSSSSRQLS